MGFHDQKIGMLDLPTKKSTVVLQKPSGTIAVRVDINTIQRKFYNALLFVAKNQLRKDMEKKVFKTTLQDLKTMLSEQEVDKHNSYYLEKVKELMHKIAEFNLLGKDLIVKDMFVLIPRVKYMVTKATGSTEIEFELTENVRNALISPNGIYANINLVVIRGLKSKYSIILYELCKDYEKRELPLMDIHTFRKLFGVENKYKRFDHLRERVLDAACKELNENENVDFLVRYKLTKTGKAYTHIKFYARPKPASLTLSQQAKRIENQVKENKDLQDLLRLLPADLRRKRKIVSIVVAGFHSKGKEYTQRQIEYVLDVLKKEKITNISGYLKNAIEKDYACVEELELVEVIDWKEKLIGRKYKLPNEDGWWKLTHITESSEQGLYDVRFDSLEDKGMVRWVRIREERLKKMASVER